MQKLNKKMNYHSGIFNRQSDIEICKAMNILFDTIDDLIEVNNKLVEDIEKLNNSNQQN